MANRGRDMSNTDGGRGDEGGCSCEKMCMIASYTGNSVALVRNCNILHIMHIYIYI